MKKRILLACVAAASISCIEDNSMPEGLRATTTSGGAKVVFDLDARPLPEIPLPNDVATRVDPDSPTGRRLNVSMISPTRLESEVRAKANDLDGWGTFAPITVQFDGLLDLHNIVDRHQELVPNYNNDAVFLVNIDPDSDEYGELVMLDMGMGNYPVTQKDPRKYFEFDPRANGSNFLFESVQEEDLNGNGELDPYEDTDDDGVWDTPNTLDLGADPLEWKQILEFYERETNTLMIRTVDALRPGTTYAIVLSDKLVDDAGRPVDSPFGYINHTRQTPELEVLRTILPNLLPERFESTLKNVRFAWSFTTQSSTHELYQIRRGLYGHGPLKWLSDEYPAELTLVHSAKTKPDDESPIIIRLDDTIVQFIVQALAGGVSDETQQLMIQGFKDIDYLVSGTFVSPYFLADRDGLPNTPEDIADNRNQFDDDEWFNIDLKNGTATHGPDEVTFWCLIPKATGDMKPPFPVVMYGHGYTSSRVEALGFAGAHAKFGIATCALDAAGHGTVIPDDLIPDVFDTTLENANLGNLLAAIQHGRARDLNNDGQVDSGGDFWTANIFHTRDILQQSALDHMQFIRILRTFDGQKRWRDSVDESNPFVANVRELVGPWDTDGDGKGEIAGDWNGDGVPDIGGERPYYMWGISLGGILAPIVAGADPTVKAAVPMSGGAGLLEIGHRSTQGGVPEAVILPMLGPLVVGRPSNAWNADSGEFEFTGDVTLEWMITSNNDDVKIPFAHLSGIEEGDQIVIRNLEREKRPELVKEEKLQARSVFRDGSFRAGLAADAVNANERRNTLGFDPTFLVEPSLARRGDASTGFKVQYFRSTGHRYPSKEDVVSKIDDTWTGAQTPDDGFSPNFRAIWTGTVTAPEDGRYEFKTVAQGAVRLYTNGNRRINDRDGEFTTAIALDAGETVHLRLEYDRTGDTGSIQLLWSNDESLSETVVTGDAVKTHIPLDSDETAELGKHTVTALGGDARDFGDEFRIEIYGQDGELKQVVDTFEVDAVHDNILYPAGSPLAALREGFGLSRQTPDMRRFLGLAQHLVDAADPAAYAPKYHRYPQMFPYETPEFQDGGTNVLYVPTGGDSAVPVVTGYAMARLGGVLEYEEVDGRYNMPANRWLIENYVYESIYWLDRFEDYPGALFDADDLDRGGFESERFPERGTDANPDAAQPLRATIETPYGVSALRVPYLRTDGEHGIFLPASGKGFDIHSFMANQISHFFATGGTEISDDPCMADYSMESCDWFERGVPMGPGPQ